MSAIPTAARIQLLWLKQLRRQLLWLLLITALGIVLVVFHQGPALLAALSPVDLTIVLKVSAALVLVLIPISGIVSTSSQYAFWSGWLGGLPQVSDLFAGEASTSQTPITVVYLDGIHQCERDHPPRVSRFLDELEQQLPAHVRLLRGLEAYTVQPTRLADDSGSQWFWQRLFALQESHPNGLLSVLCSVLVQANNVIKVGISSDRRYGPILNDELALKVCLRLAELGFRPGQHGNPGPQELVLLGYSGGSEMAMGMADSLRRLCGCPVRIISFCGVFSGNQLLEEVSDITTVVGSRDPVAAFGRIAYPGRSPLLPLSNWNRALRRGQVRRRVIEAMNHNGDNGPFSARFRGAVVAAIVTALTRPATAESMQTG